jgi:hypothetical protein
MLPNLRLVIATIFSTATLAFFFVSFASFRIAHDGLVRLPSSSVPAIQQLGFAADENWSQHDSLNGAVPAIFRSPPQTFLDPEQDANARMPQITVIAVPAAPEPEPAVAAVDDADLPAEIATPAPAAVAEAAIAEPPVEPAPPQAVAMNDMQAAVTPLAPAEAVPLPTPAPTAAERTTAKKATQAAAKTAPKAKTAKRAAKTPARPRRRVAAKPAAPAPALTSPAAARPGAKTTSSTNTTANGPFSSLFR